MFENRQSEMQQMLQSNAEFRRLYNRHQELDKRVAQAERGNAPLEDLALNQLKKEKLRAKDRLAQLLSTDIH